MTRMWKIALGVGARTLAATAASAAYAQGTTGDQATPKDWNYEIKDGKRVPKGQRQVNADGSWREEQEHFFLVLVEKFEPATARMEAEELALHQGFRWWSIDEIERSAEVFVPRRMAELLRALRDAGSPSSPIDVTDV